MKTEEFLDYLKEGESEKLEFKSRVSDDIGEEICALSNLEGGNIFVGVSDDGDIQGCDVKASKETISQHLNNITPPVEVYYDRIEIDEKEVLIVRAPESDHLCGIGGTIYLRTGTSKRPLSIPEILSRGAETLLFEVDKTPTDQLPDEEYIEEFSSKTRADIDDFHQYLRNMDAITEEGKLTLAGLLFFHEKPQSNLPHASVRMIFQDDSWKRFSGPIWKIVEDIGNELKGKLALSSIQPGFKRIDVYEYPIKAVREAIVNSLVHRNYAIKSEVFIEFDSNKLVIKNPGSFPPGTTPENPKPIPRNPIIYELMFQVGYVERQGRGIELIKEECEKHPFVSFNYELDSNFTTLTFKKEAESLSKKERDILSSLSEREKSASEIASELDLSKTTVLRKIDRLKEIGFVEKIGKGPATRYKLEEKF